MPKCRINNNNEITHFWNDSHSSIPEDAVDCDVVKSFKCSGNPPDNIKYHYKLVDGKAIATDVGLAFEALEYQRDRQYPSIGDQLDMQYHDEIDGTTTWKDAIAKVKSDNPKE